MLPMKRRKVILTRRWPAAAEAVLEEKFDAELNRDDHPFSTEELADALCRGDALCPTVTDALGSECFAPGLRAGIVANFGVGCEHIDLAAAHRHGLMVTNTPDVLTDCTADLAMTLLLMTARRAGEGERELRAGAWRGWGPTHLLGAKVAGKTLGIVGMGRIGIATARRARHGFGMGILCFSRRPAPESVLGELGAVQVDSLDELLASVDFLSLHCPANRDTRHLIDAPRLARMRPAAHLINTARGAIVDERALAEALRRGRLAGAGLDVYEREPAVLPALLERSNLVLLPHLGSATAETREAMGLRVARNLERFFAGQPPPDLCGNPGFGGHRG